MLKKFAEFFCTVFYFGNSPVAPGTGGSIASLILISPTILKPSLVNCGVAFIIVTALGFLLIPFYLEGKTADLQEIVIDEASGLYLTIFISILCVQLLGVKVNWYVVYILSFVLFRVFDITKPWLIQWCDTNLKGTVGIMVDDIVAGIFAGTVMCIMLLVYKTYIL